VTRAARHQPTDILYYEGLIKKTASMCAPHVEIEFDDIVSIFRVKVWRALESFDPARSSMPVQRYVFSCLKNQEKDLLKRRRRGELYLDDVSGAPVASGDTDDAFEGHYFAVTADDVFAEVEAEPPLIPSTLTALERAIVVRLYAGRSQRETASALGLRRSDMERALRSVREKMGDWRPAGAIEPALPACVRA
jgi:RNA polymerase sigma factor (sigma-70 family)